MDSDELKDVLQDAGLSPYQAEAYVTVLELGASPATDIAEESSVPNPRIYDVLRDLEDTGYVETYQQDSLRARARDPTGVLQDLQTRAERFADAAEEVEERWDRPAMDDHVVSFVKRFETVVQRAETLVESAENQVQLSVPVAQYDRLVPTLRTARERDVDVKLSLCAPDEAAATLPDEPELATTCTEARFRELPSPFVGLVDRSWTCFSPHGSSANEYGIIVEDRTHAYVFRWFFLTCLWEQGRRLYVDDRSDPPITYAEIRRCVRNVEPLLDDGATVRATVEGYDTATGERVEFSGRIVETVYAGASPSERPGEPSVALTGQVGLTVDTGTGTHTVGGWGATLESVEAERITITAVE